MTPNEYMILRMFAERDRVAVQQVAERVRASQAYANYLCVGMVNAGLLAECTADSAGKPVRAYALTPKSQAILADLTRGMASNLARRAAKFKRVAAVVEERAERLSQIAQSLDVPDESETKDSQADSSLTDQGPAIGVQP